MVFLFFWVIGAVVSFLLFSVYIHHIYVLPESILYAAELDDLPLSFFKGTIILAFMIISLVLNAVGYVIRGIVRRKSFLIDFLIVVSLATIISGYYLWISPFENMYIVIFVAMLLFGVLSLVVPSALVRKVRNKKNYQQATEIFT